MKTIPSRAALAGLMLASAAITVALHADNPTDASGAPPPPPPPGHHSHMGMLSPDERAELKMDRDAVFAANPDLKTQEKSLRDQQQQLMEKIDAEIVKQDPKAAPIIAKMKADHPHGPPPE